jgi:choline dehydrogenase-like flavoprotein
LKKYGFRLLLSPSSVFLNFRKLRKLIKNKTSDNSPRTDNSQGKQCLHLQFEKLSNEDSRIVLGDKVDVFGNQLPNCRLYFSPLEQSAYREVCLLVKDLYSHVSISEEVFMNQIKDFSSNPNSHAHQIGGTIMGNSPMDSVVDSDCRVHGIGNLFVAGSSVFTTASEANPTHTIVALGIRTGEFIGNLLRNSND